MSKPKKSSDARIFHTAEPQVGQTLAAALRQWLPENSWSENRRLVRTRHVQINGNLCVDEARRLKLTEVVKVHLHSLTPPPKLDDVKVVYVDEHVIVVDKPSGVTSVRHAQEQKWPARRKQFQPTLDEMLPALINMMAPKGPQPTMAKRTFRGREPVRVVEPPRIFPVHRLDRDTSGLMVFARSQFAEQNLIEQFKAHTIERAYQAVACGDVQAQKIDSIIVRDRGDGIRGSAEDDDSGQQAITHVRPLQKLGTYSLVECRLETGRTHQIRIHLSELGHVICGEKVYTKSPKSAVVDASGSPRLALHAFKLAFVHPTTNRKLSFTSELPRDLDLLVKRLVTAETT